MPLSIKVLLAAWNSCGHAVGAACGTVRSLAQAVGADEATTAAAVGSLRDAGYLEVDDFGVIAVTAAGVSAAKQHVQR